jgi:hypothetical protein
MAAMRIWSRYRPRSGKDGPYFSLRTPGTVQNELDQQETMTRGLAVVIFFVIGSAFERAKKARLILGPYESQVE